MTQDIIRLQAEEVAANSPVWTIELHPDRLRFVPPEGSAHELPRDTVLDQTEVVMGLSLRRILLANLRDPKRKDAFRFDHDSFDQLTEWLGWPRSKDLAKALKHRNSTNLLVGIVFIASAFMNTSVRGTEQGNIYIFFGVWLIMVWMASRARPGRLLFLLDSGVYALMALALGAALGSGFDWISGVLFVCCAGLVATGVNKYAVFKGLKGSV